MLKHVILGLPNSFGGWQNEPSNSRNDTVGNKETVASFYKL
jgi:hypothetical protein